MRPSELGRTPPGAGTAPNASASSELPGRLAPGIKTVFVWCRELALRLPAPNAHETSNQQRTSAGGCRHPVIRASDGHPPPAPIS